MTRHDEPAEGDVAGVAEADVMSLVPVLVQPLHEALCLDRLPGECMQHPGCEIATDLAAALLASDALHDLLAAAWDKGHRTRQRLGDDGCRCGAWSVIECACGKYGTNVITPNPYRATERAQ